MSTYIITPGVSWVPFDIYLSYATDFNAITFENWFILQGNGFFMLQGNFVGTPSVFQPGKLNYQLRLDNVNSRFGTITPTQNGVGFANIGGGSLLPTVNQFIFDFNYSLSLAGSIFIDIKLNTPPTADVDVSLQMLFRTT